jgi:hypothetical protein
VVSLKPRPLYLWEGTPWIPGCLGPRAGLDAVEKSGISNRYRYTNPGTAQPIAWSLYRQRYPDSNSVVGTGMRIQNCASKFVRLHHRVNCALNMEDVISKNISKFSRDSVASIVTRLRAQWSGVQFPVKVRDCFFSRTTRPAVGLDHPPIECIPGTFPRGKGGGA